jgi:hypothetical protein
MAPTAAPARGLRPILAGRSRAALAAVATPLGLEERVFALDDAAALDARLAEARVVLHCAGPFAHTAPAAAAVTPLATLSASPTAEPPTMLETATAPPAAETAASTTSLVPTASPSPAAPPPPAEDPTGGEGVVRVEANAAVH